MKTYSTRQLAHVWAQQSEPAGKSNGALSFTGETLYSYGTPIARFVKAGDRPVALFSVERHSPTTGKHSGMAFGAVANIPRFIVPSIGISGGRYKQRLPDGEIDHAANLKHLVEAYRVLSGRLEHSAQPRDMPEKLENELTRCSLGAFEYAGLFGLEPPAIDVAADAQAMAARIAARYTPEALAKRQRAAEKRKAAKDAREERARAEALERAAADLAKWRNGETGAFSSYYSYGVHVPVAMRLKDAETIETSQGAEFPVSHAIRAFRLIAALRANQRGWERNGHSIHLGHFQIDKVEANGNVRAGCHYVEWAEIELMARTLKERGYDIDLPGVA